jgi:hypothetical protein
MGSGLAAPRHGKKESKRSSSHKMAGQTAFPQRGNPCRKAWAKTTVSALKGQRSTAICGIPRDNSMLPATDEERADVTRYFLSQSPRVEVSFLQKVYS